VNPLSIFRLSGNRKPAVRSGGLPDPSGSNHVEKDTTNMSAIPLFNKTPPVLSGGKISPSQRLRDWIVRGRSEVFSVVTLVTPDMARVLIALNTENRPVIWNGANRSVSAYAAAMKRGEWTLNGEAVIVSSNGELNDGQHRLYAVIESGGAVMMMLTFGVARETRHTVDQGVARTPGHILVMMGEKDANNLATALQYLWTRDAGLSLNMRPSPDQLLATLQRHPAIRDAVKAANPVAQFHISRGYIGAAHYECRKADAYAADTFLQAVVTGLNIQNVNSPVNKLRKAYQEHDAKRKLLGRIEQAALYIKAFNAFRQGRTPKLLMWRNTGESAEVFPRVEG
jgi:hypothetical protein